MIFQKIKDNLFMNTIVKYINRENKTIIFVTHRETAIKKADKVIHMESGRIKDILLKDSNF